MRAPNRVRVMYWCRRTSGWGADVGAERAARGTVPQRGLVGALAVVGAWALVAATAWVPPAATAEPRPFTQFGIGGTAVLRTTSDAARRATAWTAVDDVGAWWIRVDVQWDKSNGSAASTTGPSSTAS